MHRTSLRLATVTAAALLIGWTLPAQAQQPDASTPPAAAAATAAPADATQGKLAYYGRKFAGRRTASGERFNPDALTMAHNTLPFGTLVRVTHAQNKRSVTVRVNDRGPTSPDRIGDLSLAAARRIGMLRAGVAEASLEVVGKAQGRAG